MATPILETKVHIPRHCYTVEDFYRMGETGILGPETRVELIWGEVIDMVPIGSLHAAVVDELVLHPESP